MISKPLFKQSCKANIGIWSFVTLITCFMLAIIIAVLGNLNVGSIRDSMVDMFVTDAIESTTQKQSMTYYNITENALTTYESQRVSLNYLLNQTLSDEQKSQIIGAYNSLVENGKSDNEAREILLFGKEENEKLAINTLITYYLAQGENYTQADINYFVLRSIEEEIYNSLVESEGEMIAQGTKEIISQAISDFTESGSDNASDFATFYIPQTLKKILITQSFDYQDRTLSIKDYFTEEKLGDISLSSIISYKAQLDVKEKELREKISTENPTFTQEQIDEEVDKELQVYKAELIPSLSSSILDDLPKDVADALTELGSLDISSLVIGSMFFRMAGILLPIVYIIMASNNLMASQVDSGSMAYVLSTPTKRRTVSITQMLFLVGSLFAMFVCTTIVGLVSLAIVNSSAISIGYVDMVLFNLGAFVAMFAISGICFLASSWFNRSKLSMSIGGGLSMFFLVTTILGLFGSKVIPSAMRIDAMNYFNYFSIISLYDCESIMSGSLTFLWKLAILLGIGIVTYIIAIFKFKKKDLPL